MIRGVLNVMLVAAASIGLAACAPGVTPGTASGTAPGTASGTASGTAALQVSPAEAALYAARQDGAFALPAIDIEKVPAQFRRQTVDFQTSEAPGTIIINPSAHVLHLVIGKNKAIRYGIAVGRAGFEWSGVAIVNERKQWPTWTPPAEMIARKPELAKYEKGQPGGLTNPLGARALYLTSNGVDYGYRIHGTPDWQSIGTNASSGCIRMINQDVIDLFSRVPTGAKVIVLNADGSMPTGLTLPPETPKAKKAKAVVVEDAEPVVPAVAPAAPLAAAPVAPVAAVVTTAPAALAPAPVAVKPAPAAVAPATVAPAIPDCTVALVNGLCPAAKP